MEVVKVTTLAARELADAWRNRWFLGLTVTFAVAALVLAWVSVGGLLGSGVAGLGRTAASLIHLVLLVVPLMGLLLGAQAIAGERERGALLYLLAQPVDVGEVVVGKFVGLAGAILAALLLGFGGAGGVVAAAGSPAEATAYLAFLGLAVLLALACLSLGLLISALAAKGSVATGIALLAWLVLVFVGDLGLMGTSLVLELSPRSLLIATLANPLQLFKVGAVVAMRGGLEVLGSAGLYAERAWGGALVPTLVGFLAAWIAVPLALAGAAVRRRGAVP